MGAWVVGAVCTGDGRGVDAGRDSIVTTWTRPTTQKEEEDEEDEEDEDEETRKEREQSKKIAGQQSVVVSALAKGARLSAAAPNPHRYSLAGSCRSKAPRSLRRWLRSPLVHS